ncbi:MAG: ORF6N domain-containing protein [bacterium]
MGGKSAKLTEGHAAPRIIMVRGLKVILDSDLARLYGVETFRFNEAVKRNRGRFPSDFAFQLTNQEFSNLISQIAISNSGHGGVRKLPWVFTEHGAVMAANLLRSEKAVQMSVFVVRAFVKMREHLVSTRELALRLTEIEKQLVVHDSALVELYQLIQPLLLLPDDPPAKPIGFGCC